MKQGSKCNAPAVQRKAGSGKNWVWWKWSYGYFVMDSVETPLYTESLVEELNPPSAIKINMFRRLSTL